MTEATWPYTTPEGYVYSFSDKNPCMAARIELLQIYADDYAQGYVEGWDKAELPPQPTWEMVGVLLREIQRYRNLPDYDKQSPREVGK